MKFALSFILFASFLSASWCQSALLQELPSCAATCLTNTISLSSCSPTDFACLCTDTHFLTAASACQAKSCTVKEVLTSTNITLAACGVPNKDQSSIVYTIVGVFGTIAVFMTALRIIDRVWVNKISLGWDDIFILCATALAIPVNCLCLASAYYGLGKDIWTLEFHNINMTFKMVYVAEIFYMASEMFVQLSLLAFLLRVFAHRQFKIGVWVLMAIVTGFGISNSFVMIFATTPIPFFWQGWAGEMKGTGIQMNLYSWIRAAIEISIDISIICLPLPHLWKLQMSWHKKMQVISVFCVGFVITIVSILRLRSLIQYSKTQNPTYDNTAAIYWSVLENDMFIICACMPAMRPLLRRLAPSFFGSTGNHSAANRYGTPDGFGPSAKYVRYSSKRGHSSEHSDSSKTGVITKAIDVTSYRTERSPSDVELVRPIPGKIFGA